MTRAIVAGSGMAGLTAAAYLAKDGCQVDIYEQADHIGGVTATISKNGYSWDLGPIALEGFGPGVWTQIISSRNVYRTLRKEI